MIDKSDKVVFCESSKYIGTEKENCNFVMDGSNMNPLMKRKPTCCTIHYCTFLSGNKADLCCFETKNVLLFGRYI